MDNLIMIMHEVVLDPPAVYDEASKLLQSDKSSIIDKIFLGLFIGFTSTFIYFIVSQVFRPRIRISKHISLEPDGFYRIKIINKTFSNIEKISLQLFLMKKVVADKKGNKNFKLNNVELASSEYTFINGRIMKDKKLNDNCLQLKIKDDLGSIWTDSNDVLVFYITAYHSISGNRRICRKKYHHPCSTIINGEFKSGNSMQII